MQDHFKYNPFAGIHDEDIEETLVPRIDIEGVIEKINKSQSLAIEFLGKQGRGKTSHLKFLHQRLDQYPIYLLNANSAFSEIINNQANVVFIDSIHHLNFANRTRLFKSSKTIVYTAHWTKKIECFIARKKIHTYRFKGIDPDFLQQMINKRLLLATKKNIAKKEYFTKEDIDALIIKFGDNYRGIINHLYARYQ